MNHATRPDAPTLAHDLALFTDLYELTMCQGYLLSGRADLPVSCDYFSRTTPFEGGWTIFAGLDELLSQLRALRFEPAHIDALHALKIFKPEFLKFLSTWRFEADVDAVREGELVFPLEPALRVTGRIFDAQLIESLLLNTLNFCSLIATKASRIKYAAGQLPVVEFGLRRAQGLGALQATRAAFIGGVDATSNLLAAHQWGLDVVGTHAHAWVQSFGDELTAFRAMAEHYPERCVLLVDTYNTLHSGIPNAIIVARELAARGHKLAAIRLDSGDLAYLSKKARAQLDAAGLSDVKIYVTNQLDEHLIKSLLDQGAPIDLFGVGTRLVTGHPDAALDGVYKMGRIDGADCLKISDNFTKVNLPGDKALYRFLQEDGSFYGDGIALGHESAPDTIYHPFFPEQSSRVAHRAHESLLRPVMRAGQPVAPATHPLDARAYAIAQLKRLPDEHKRFANPHTYKVGVSKGLLDLRASVYAETRARTTPEAP
jgi:nicotinate phosphoribosyltransferase